jgi:hypothetical protein
LNSYAALWSCNHAVYAGKAALEGRSLLLTGVDRGGREARERLELGEVVAVQVARGAQERLEGRPVLVLTMSHGPPLRLACLDGGGTLLELAERLNWMKESASVGC